MTENPFEKHERKMNLGKEWLRQTADEMQSWWTCGEPDKRTAEDNFESSCNWRVVLSMFKEIDQLKEKVKELQEHISKDDIARLKWEHLIAQGEALGIVVTEEKQANGITRITSRNARAEKAESDLGWVCDSLRD
jgi:hypothetical protein